VLFKKKGSALRNIMILIFLSGIFSIVLIHAGQFAGLFLWIGIFFLILTTDTQVEIKKGEISIWYLSGRKVVLPDVNDAGIHFERRHLRSGGEAWFNSLEIRQKGRTRTIDIFSYEDPGGLIKELERAFDIKVENKERLEKPAVSFHRPKSGF